MQDIIKTGVAGVVAIGLVAAFGIHAAGLTQLTKAGGTASQGIIGTAEKG